MTAQSFAGHQLTKKGASLNINQTKVDLIDGIKNAINVRFADMHTDFEPMMIASLKHWPEEMESQGAHVFKAACVFMVLFSFQMHVYPVLVAIYLSCYCCLSKKQ